MHTGLEDHARDFPKLAAYFAERARGGAGLIVTGGFAPNRRGHVLPDGVEADDPPRGAPAPPGDGCRARGGWADRAADPARGALRATPRWCVAPSAVKSPISKFTPRALSDRGVRRQIRAFARAARLAREAGYDGVEIMGSEGYLINQFLAPRTNKRIDAWGGSPSKRRRFAVETVRAVREAVGSDFIVIYRISVLDLVDEGQTWDEVTALATRSRPPGPACSTSASAGTRPGCRPSSPRCPAPRSRRTPRGSRSTCRCPSSRRTGSTCPTSPRRCSPVGPTSSRWPGRSSPTPSGCARRAESRADEINTCIACNQACLDHTFVKQARHLPGQPARRARDRAGARADPHRQEGRRRRCRPGRARRRHDAGRPRPRGRAVRGPRPRGRPVRHRDAHPGQGGVRRDDPLLHPAPRPDRGQGAPRPPGRADELVDAGFTEVVVATGVVPRMPAIPGIEHPMVMTYAELVRGERTAGRPGGRRRRRRHRGRRQRVPHHRALRHPRRRRVEGRVGRRRPGRRPAAGWPGRGPSRARARWCCCSASRARSARAWARPRAGCTGPRSGPRVSSR